MSRSPLDTWSRSVRRAVREWTAQAGLVPPLFGAVSVGGNPRRVEALMRLDILADRESVEDTLRGMAGRHGSRFGAYGGVVGDRFGGELRLVAFSAVSQEAWTAQVSVEGVGGWGRVSVDEVSVAPGFLQGELVV